MKISPSHLRRYKDVARLFMKYGDADLIQQGMTSGEFAAGNAQQAAIVLISALEGVILLHTLNASQDSLGSQLMAAAEIFLSGLKNPAQDTTI